MSCELFKLRAVALPSNHITA